ncbi:AraC-like DNA-binding protein [Anaerobacterium chartisolvens]|uniref:AraC-like DNA-binding protein n=1 Tax=Anaerobacterium chartisolvens TaxID=1297424 RepID=A0A369B687_9FIRM|nr:AraC family transcriptional regulator [Anaerobacterium chartisolvens]RCX16047.1 AraC-like DNA-binding protein [Anaerobacterium chartisolvens]
MAFYENTGYSPNFPIIAKKLTDATSLPHWHPEYELSLVCEGSVGMGRNSEYRVLKKGDIAFCGVGDLHYFNSKGMHSTVVTIIFRPELLGNAVDLSAYKQSTIPLLDSAAVEELKLEASALNEMTYCIDSIYKEMSAQRHDYKLFVKADLIKLFGLFSRHIPKSAIELDGNTAGPRSITLVQSAMKYIENNYSQDISLDEISEYLKISPFYFSRIFSSVTGLTYKNYLNKTRVEKAHNLLETTTMSVTDIAYECGYNSLRTFNRAFKELKGSTPSSLRHAADL